MEAKDTLKELESLIVALALEHLRCMLKHQTHSSEHLAEAIKLAFQVRALLG